MALSFIRSLLYVGVHPLQTAQQCYDTAFTTGSCVVRELVDVVTGVSSGSLSVAAIGPALLDVLHAPAAEELCAAAVALVKTLHSLLHSEHVPALLTHLLGLLRSPACAEAVDALTTVALAFVRLCQTQQMERASALTAQAIHAVHSHLTPTPPPPPSQTDIHPTANAWLDCLLFLLRLSTADGGGGLSSAEMEVAMRLVTERDVRLRDWWVRREGGGGVGRVEVRMSEEGRGYRLPCEASSEEEEEEVRERVALLELHRLLAAADASHASDGSCS